MRKLVRIVLVVIVWLFFWPYLGSTALVRYAFDSRDSPIDDIVRFLGLALQVAYFLFPIVFMIYYSCY